MLNVNVRMVKLKFTKSEGLSLISSPEDGNGPTQKLTRFLRLKYLAGTILIKQINRIEMKAKLFVGQPRSGKTRTAMMISEFFNKENVSIVDGRKFDRYIISYPFLLSEVSDKTELLIIDDLHPDFDFSFFFPVKRENDDSGNFKFLITIERQGSSRIQLKIPYLIFTSNFLDPKLGLSPVFSNRFDVIEFPLEKLK